MTSDLQLNGNAVCSMPKPEKKVVLWHVATGCNLRCKYCYGSFDGASYNETAHLKTATSLEHLRVAAQDLAAAGFSRAHICGGEPFLFKDLWSFMRILTGLGIERFVLTNGTLMPNGIREAIQEGLFNNLSFSIDSLDSGINDVLRGRTTKVLKNIGSMIELRNQLSPSLDIGLYIVLTKANLSTAITLIDEMVSRGVNFITVQICYLPDDHPQRNSLGIGISERENVLSVLSHLRRKSAKGCRIPGEPFFALSESVLKSGELSAINCFADHGDFLFIDGEGNVYPCATKAGEQNCLGNITKARLADLSKPSEWAGKRCRLLCADCLGAWEMVYPQKPG